MSMRIIFVDLDLTVTNSQKVVLAETKEALREVQEKGYRINLCTGRQWPFIPSLLDLPTIFKAHSRHIIAGGAQIIDNQGQIKWQAQIAPEIVAEIFAQAQKWQVNLITSDEQALIINHELAMTKLKTELFTQPIKCEKNYAQATNLIVANHLQAEFEQFLTQLMREQKISAKKMIDYQGNFFYDITAYQVDKGQAVQKWAQIEKMPLSQMAMVGDSLNDLPALQIVGYPFIMGNAVPELRNGYHFEVLGETDDLGLALWLNSLPPVETKY